ncbi:hypothetical protein [Aequitasia blattaphilus]|uniref:Uncharacterized protein n=1 Tax=Aequitasia blattaphilus TaxID=2949332 RepID=A0ABT1E7S3_9FIRM|nr:hypothetical protein [Aequitasia blattaphilus]MCP1101873.1 hypothetical protein [Aequitasia blattaphilus]MCR8614513.1 hypothetical protein [Aequitasia blattaphilus]
MFKKKGENKNGESVPMASNIENIDITKGMFTEDGKSFISYVDVDFNEYRRKMDNKVVRTNVTLPNWLKQKADKEGMNLSKTLQEALISKMGVSR